MIKDGFVVDHRLFLVFGYGKVLGVVPRMRRWGVIRGRKEVGRVFGR
jgi:hypothetical protein